ncbi:MAG: hypothetical protein U0I41_03415 [Coprococcus sp.]|nr:hypothetical protein [Coprococcus sp.]
MKKNLVILITLILSLVVLVGCGASVAKEKQIQEDLEAFSDKVFLDDGETITSLVIDKRDTDKKQKTDRVWCTVTTEKDDISYEKGVMLDYYLYDKAGWTLDDYTIDDSEKWVIRPLKGVNEGEISTSLIGKTIMVDDEEWGIGEGEVSNLSIQSQNTNLEKNTDQVTVEVVLESDVERVTGVVTADYQFDKAWKITNLSVKDTLSAEIKDGKALNIDAEKLKADVNGHQEEYGLKDNTHKITIKKSGIEDLKIVSQQSESKGCTQVIHYSAKLVKKNVTFNMDAETTYTYSEDKWTYQGTQVDLSLDSVDLLGTWKGTYTAVISDGVNELDITEVDGNNITATYSYTPYKIIEPGSYTVQGEFNPETLELVLQAGDWVQEPTKGTTYVKSNVSATLYVDEGTMEGIGHDGNGFVMSKQQ